MKRVGSFKMPFLGQSLSPLCVCVCVYTHIGINIERIGPWGLVKVLALGGGVSLISLGNRGQFVVAESVKEGPGLAWPG